MVPRQRRETERPGRDGRVASPGSRVTSHFTACPDAGKDRIIADRSRVDERPEGVDAESRLTLA
jgi:hypothetical protein